MTEPARAWRARIAFAIGLLVLVWAYRVPVLGYLRDQHYQEHFVYLWVFFGLALWRSLRGPFRWRLGGNGSRDRFAIGGAVIAGAMLWLSAAGGSSTGQRTSLAVFLTSLALASVPRWTGRRCVMHGLLFLLCFGVPYSIYFPLTSQLQWGVTSVLALPAHLGLVDYEVVGHVVVFPHYSLAITADCSGIGQLLTFVGIAALGVLSAAANRRRTLLILAVAVVLAWLSNLARVALFVALVAGGFTAAIDDTALHAGLGFLVFLPFVVALVWLILRTHVPPLASRQVDVNPGSRSVGWLLAPVCVAALVGSAGSPPLPAPPYFERLLEPPGHHLELRAPSEEGDRAAYATPWLVNARFAAHDGSTFDLLHFVTDSRSQLCVHKVANCLYSPGASLHYESPMVVVGHEWWRLGVDAGELSTHVYFAFEVDGARCDDSWATSWRVFRSRLLGHSAEVRLWRVTFPGPLPAAPDEREQQVLAWLGTFSVAATPALPSGR